MNEFYQVHWEGYSPKYYRDFTDATASLLPEFDEKGCTLLGPALHNPELESIKEQLDKNFNRASIFFHTAQNTVRIRRMFFEDSPEIPVL